MKLSKIFQVLRKYFSDGSYRILLNSAFGIYNKLPDEEYLKLRYKAVFKKPLDLEKPQTFNEKLQWLKLHDRKPEYTIYVDKYKVREYIAKTIGKEYLIPLLGVWDTPDEIDFDRLPNQFVLKCNHNSGLGMCICKDKNHLNIAKVKKDLWRGLKQDYYLTGREWPYKNVPRKIIAEKYMSDGTNQPLTDYKFFCFGGNVDCVMVCLDRQSGTPKFYFFNKDWQLLRYNVRGKGASDDFTLPKPDCLGEMFRIAGRLSQDKLFSRIDLYNCNGRVYFGEITFFPESGFDKNLLQEADEYWGNMINLNGDKAK